MAKDLNSCSFIGRLGKDVEMRYMPSGEAFANFSIAVGEQWKDKQTGEKKEKTEWVNISCFGKLAEICGEYLKKGSKIYANGSMETRKYTGNDGVEKYATGIKLKDMQMLDSVPQQGHQGQQHPPAHQQRPQQAPQQAPQQQHQSWGNAPQQQQQNGQAHQQQQQQPPAQQQQHGPAYQQPPSQNNPATHTQPRQSAPAYQQNSADGFDDTIPF
jgi:single-strand DNA-binding protein